MAHSLPDLPYAHDALAPHIGADTMEIHHGKHHNAYVTNLNAALEGTGLEDKDLGAKVDRAGDSHTLALATGERSDGLVDVTQIDAHFKELLLSDAFHCVHVKPFQRAPPGGQL